MTREFQRPGFSIRREARHLVGTLITELQETDHQSDRAVARTIAARVFVSDRLQFALRADAECAPGGSVADGRLILKYIPRRSIRERSNYLIARQRPVNLTGKQVVKLKELMEYNLAAIRAYLLREDFRRFWEYHSPAWAGKFLDDWITHTQTKPSATPLISRFP